MNYHASEYKTTKHNVVVILCNSKRPFFVSVSSRPANIYTTKKSVTSSADISVGPSIGKHGFAERLNFLNLEGENACPLLVIIDCFLESLFELVEILVGKVFENISPQILWDLIENCHFWKEMAMNIFQKS